MELNGLLDGDDTLDAQQSAAGDGGALKGNGLLEEDEQMEDASASSGAGGALESNGLLDELDDPAAPAPAPAVASIPQPASNDFSCNGLLDEPEPAAGTSTSSAAPSLPTTSSTAFASNGLLDEEPSDDTSSALAALLDAEAAGELRSNGLLDEPGLSRLSPSPFASNGLLDSPSDARRLSPSPPSAPRTSTHAASSSTSLFHFAVPSTSPLASGTIPLGAATGKSFSGTMLRFERRKKLDALRQKASAYEQSASARVSLLETPIHRLLEELESERALAPERLAANLPSKPRTQQTQLWVDQYRPKKFTDLLGDERVHRETMAWLKEWDQCVFKRWPAKAKRQRDDKENFVYRDPMGLGRPQERIMLVSGPPGLGKTTLTHIVARHAGYRVFEVNASDDRSGKSVEDRVRTALETASITQEGTTDTRPTLIVIDEIDGATGGEGGGSFIRQLLKLIQDVPAKKRINGTKSEAKALLRPIICICNDLYAPSLRPLRSVARLVRFKKPPTAALVARLREVCAQERLAADTRSLSLLAEVTGGDIRSCLNTLQFIKSKSDSVTEASLRAAAVGSKDSGSSVHVVWDRLFRPPGKKDKKTIGLGENAKKDAEDGKFVSRLVHELVSCGEYDKVSQGCFEHYPSLRATDAGWTKYVAAHDWLAFTDRLSSAAYAEREYEMLGYMPYSLVSWYHFFNSVSNTVVAYPNTDYESYLKRQTNEEIAGQLRQALPPTLSSAFNRTTVCTELAPLLMRIVSANLKPVNQQVVKPEEKAALVHVVDVMLALKLAFVQDKGEDGQIVYRLEPPIDVFVHYEGKRAADIAVSRYAVRHLVAREMDAELIRRQEKSGGGPAKDSAAAIKAKAKPAEKVEATERPPTDFFGRLIVPKAAPGDSSASITAGSDSAVAGAPPPAKKFRAFYKYHEGFSNAVRRPVKMSTLL